VQRQALEQVAQLERAQEQLLQQQVLVQEAVLVPVELMQLSVRMRRAQQR
jgi:hypothetical protein